MYSKRENEVLDFMEAMAYELGYDLGIVQVKNLDFYTSNFRVWNDQGLDFDEIAIAIEDVLGYKCEVAVGRGEATFTVYF